MEFSDQSIQITIEGQHIAPNQGEYNRGETNLNFLETLWRVSGESVTPTPPKSNNQQLFTRHLPMDTQAIVFNHQIDSNRCKTPRKLAKNCPQQSKLQYRFGDTDVTQSELDSLQIKLISPPLHSARHQLIQLSSKGNFYPLEHLVSKLCRHPPRYSNHVQTM